MTKSHDEKDLNPLFDLIIEDALELSDEALREELESEGGSIEESAARVAAAVERARASVGIERLAAARRGFNAQRAAARPRKARTGAEARRMLARLQASRPDLTLAARGADGEELSDHDAIKMLEDYESLGIVLDEDDDA